MQISARWWLAAVVAAGCGGAPGAGAGPGSGATPVAPGRPSGMAPARAEPTAVDVLAALARDPGATSWLVPGRIQLELGGRSAVIEAPGGDKPLAVDVLERQGNLVRAGVRLERLRFAVWTDRSRLLSVIQRATAVVSEGPPVAGGSGGAVLQAGAPVTRLARRPGATRVRYVGQLEVDGWVPDAALGEAGVAPPLRSMHAMGRSIVHVMPGAVIRSAARWSASPLALVADGYQLAVVRDVDDAWAEVEYSDGAVSVRGFVSRRDPPGRVHRAREPASAPVAIAANGVVAAGTCLHARAGGEPVGVVRAELPAELEAAGGGWWRVALDTPWGAIAFVARGSDRDALASCP